MTARTDKRTPQADARSVLTVKELAMRWGVDVKTLYEAIELGQIPVFRIGKRVLRVPLSFVVQKEQGGDVLPGSSHGSVSR